MQTMSTALKAAIHSQNRQPFSSVVIDDMRIRGWIRTDLGLRTIDPFDACASGANLVRAYNVSTADPGVLHIAKATIGTTPTFSDIGIGTVNTRRYSGVALFTDPTDSSPNRVDCYYIDNTGSGALGATPNLKNMTSANNGTTWAAGAFSHGMQDPQIVKSRPQLAVAGWVGNGGSYNPYLFYTSASSAVNSTGNVNLCFYDGGANTNSRCTLGALGIPAIKGVPGSGVSPAISGLAAYRYNLTDFVCFVTINSPRGLSESGIYQIWYRDGIWGQAQAVRPYQTQLAGNATYSISFPTVTLINGIAWLMATETIAIPGLGTSSAQQTVSHLLLFRSEDSIHWSDATVIAGTDNIGNGYWNNATNAANNPNTYDTQFALNDFLSAQLIVSTTRTFLVGYGLTFQMASGTPSPLATSASDYAGNALDVTGDLTGWELDCPAQTAMQGTLTIQNSTGQYNNSTILRRGSRVILKAGYHTTDNNVATDAVTLCTGIIDEVRQETELGKNEITVTFQDQAMKRLNDWTSDLYWEYSSGRHVYVPNISDYGSTVQVQGSWTLQGSGGGMLANYIDPATVNSPPGWDILIANAGRVEDGIFDVKLAFTNTTTGIKVGPVFRFQDNNNFYYLAYDGTLKYWQLFQWQNGNLNILTGTIGTLTTLPAAGQTWWVRVHLYQNQIVCSARQDGTNKWLKILDNSTLTLATSIGTNTGYFGAFANPSGTAGTAVTASEKNNQTASGAYEPLGEFLACRFTAPTFTGGGTTLTSYAVRLDVKGDPKGSVTFKILPDNNNITPKANTFALAGATQTLQMSQIVNGGWTTITINQAGGVPLTAGAHYWIDCEFALGFQDATHTIYWETNVNGPEVQGVTDQGNAGGSWATFGDGSRPLFAITASGSNGGAVAVGGYILYSQEEPVTLDYLCNEIAIKAGAPGVTPNYVLNETFSGTLATNWDTAGQKPAGTGWTIVSGQVYAYNAANTYGYLRSTAQGMGEMVAEFDMTLGSDQTVGGGFFFNQQNNLALTTTANLCCFYVEFNVFTNNINIFALNGAEASAANRIFITQPVFNLVAGKQYHVKIQHSGKFITVYLNGALVAAVREDNIPTIDITPMNPPGYVGLVSLSNNGVLGGSNDVAHPAVIFDNVVIKELKEIKDYFVIDANQTGLQALQNLVKYDRVHFFGDYSGQLRYAYYDSNLFSETTKYVIIKGTKVSTDREWVSHIRPYGDYNADRYSGYELDLDGTRFRQLDYTDARSDRSAYHAGAYPLRLAREAGDTYEFTHPANPGLEREDRITIWNGLDSTASVDYLVDSVHFTYTPGEPGTGTVFDMEVIGRKFISSYGEGAG